MPMFDRSRVVEEIRRGIAHSPVVTVLGPRRCGKTTLARQFCTSEDQYFDLEKFSDLVRVEQSFFRVLDDAGGVVVIDEAQAKPELFNKLRVLVDRPDNRARFIITGSASPGIIRGVSESLAGRVRLIQLGGFTVDEVGMENWKPLWLRGGFPESFIRPNEDESLTWRLDYIQTFLSRDLRLLAETQMSEADLRRLLLLLAHSHGQFWNHSQAAQQIGVNYKTIQRHIDLFTGAFILRELPPYIANVRKRIRKAHRIYFRDSGLLHALLATREFRQIEAHPRYGASWEGFCIEQIVRMTRSRDSDCYVYSVQGGEEIDLVLQTPRGLFGFEFKASDAPRISNSMKSSVESLGELARLFVVYPGEIGYPLADRIEVVGFQNLPQLVARIVGSTS